MYLKNMFSIHRFISFFLQPLKLIDGYTINVPIFSQASKFIAGYMGHVPMSWSKIGRNFKDETEEALEDFNDYKKTSRIFFANPKSLMTYGQPKQIISNIIGQRNTY